MNELTAQNESEIRERTLLLILRSLPLLLLLALPVFVFITRPDDHVLFTWLLGIEAAFSAVAFFFFSFETDLVGKKAVHWQKTLLTKKRIIDYLIRDNIRKAVNSELMLCLIWEIAAIITLHAESPARGEVPITAKIAIAVSLPELIFMIVSFVRALKAQTGFILTHSEVTSVDENEYTDYSTDGTTYSYQCIICFDRATIPRDTVITGGHSLFGEFFVGDLYYLVIVDGHIRAHFSARSFEPDEALKKELIIESPLESPHPVEEEMLPEEKEILRAFLRGAPAREEGGKQAGAFHLNERSFVKDGVFPKLKHAIIWGPIFISLIGFTAIVSDSPSRWGWMSILYAPAFIVTVVFAAAALYVRGKRRRMLRENTLSILELPLLSKEFITLYYKFRFPDIYRGPAFGHSSFTTFDTTVFENGRIKILTEARVFAKAEPGDMFVILLHEPKDHPMGTELQMLRLKTETVIDDDMQCRIKRLPIELMRPSDRELSTADEPVFAESGEGSPLSQEKAGDRQRVRQEHSNDRIKPMPRLERVDKQAALRITAAPEPARVKRGKPEDGLHHISERSFVCNGFFQKLKQAFIWLGVFAAIIGDMIVLDKAADLPELWGPASVLYVPAAVVSAVFFIVAFASRNSRRRMLRKNTLAIIDLPLLCWDEKMNSYNSLYLWFPDIDRGNVIYQTTPRFVIFEDARIKVSVSHDEYNTLNVGDHYTLLLYETTDSRSISLLGIYPSSDVVIHSDMQSHIKRLPREFMRPEDRALIE